MTNAAARVLFSGLVDYAGLFPPAALSMEEAAAEYARQRRGEHAWIVGRFVTPAARLGELGRAAALGGRAGVPWPVSALLAAETGEDVERVRAVARDQSGTLSVDSLELRAPATPEELEGALALLPPGVRAAVELPTGGGLEPMLEVLARHQVQAKIRTGGVTEAAIPPPQAVAGFLLACGRARVPFKATAGLHHALRALRPLTYEADAPRATMHGFVNLLAAAALAWSGASVDDIEDVLVEQDPACFRIDDDGLLWRGRAVATAELAAVRSSFFRSLGSCSIAEPLQDLRLLGWLA